MGKERWVKKEGPYGRYWEIDGIDHYGVTVALNFSADKSFLEEWKKRVGEEEAERITKQAQAVGNDYHSLAEKYLLKEPLPKKQWIAEDLWNKSVPYLEGKIDEVIWIEKFVRSPSLRLIGRIDAIVIWQGELCILDFKTINHNNPEWMKDYWLQCAIYSYMWNEISGDRPKKIVLLCANKKELKVTHHESSPDVYAKEAAQRIKDFFAKLKADQLC